MTASTSTVSRARPSYEEPVDADLVVDTDRPIRPEDVNAVVEAFLARMG